MSFVFGFGYKFDTQFDYIFLEIDDKNSLLGYLFDVG